MKKFLQLATAILFLGMLSFQSAFAQPCVELGTPVQQLSPILKTVSGVCGPAAVPISVCDCPDGFVAVGYQGLEGNQWGAMVLSQFSLLCKELNNDGTLGAMVEVTCSNGSGAGNTADGPILAPAGEALVGFELRLGCAVDAVMGESKSIAGIAAGLPNSTSNPLTGIGGVGGSPQPVMYVPNGNVVVGMQVYEDPNTNLSGGVAWRYAPIVTVACSVGCDITSVSASNISACNNGGTDDVATDDTFTADITVNFMNPPASGTLSFSGDGTGSIAVGSLVGNSHTFTGVQMTANGTPIFLSVSFSDAAGCSQNANAGVAPAACSPDAPVAGIPTMSEWGLILFALIIFTMSVVFGTQQQRSLSMASGEGAVSFRSSMPFDKAVYLRVLPLVLMAIGLIFTVAVVFTGYELTSADVPGSVIAGALVAYLIHFTMVSSEE